MALSYKMMGGGMPGLLVNAGYMDVANALTATGANQAAAYAVTTAFASFSTVAAATGARLSLDAVPGDSQLIYNGGANTLSVYPPTGGQINALGSNNPASLAVNTACEYKCVASNQWAAILSA